MSDQAPRASTTGARQPTTLSCPAQPSVQRSLLVRCGWHCAYWKHTLLWAQGSEDSLSESEDDEGAQERWVDGHEEEEDENDDENVVAPGQNTPKAGQVAVIGWQTCTRSVVVQAFETNHHCYNTPTQSVKHSVFAVTRNPERRGRLQRAGRTRRGGGRWRWH